MSQATVSQEKAAEALAGQTTYREHLHRNIMLPMEAKDHRLAGLGLAFWPTRRDVERPEPLDPPILNCQRCGKCVAPSAGWWCQECWKVVPWLQCCCGLSMVQICRLGEFDPPWSLWIQDFAPWLLGKRLDFIRYVAVDAAKVRPLQPKAYIVNYQSGYASDDAETQKRIERARLAFQQRLARNPRQDTARTRSPHPAMPYSFRSTRRTRPPARKPRNDDTFYAFVLRNVPIGGEFRLSVMLSSWANATRPKGFGTYMASSVCRSTAFERVERGRYRRVA